MFENMRKCLDDFEANIKKCETVGIITKEDDDAIWYFYLDFAKAMLTECPDVEKIARVILVERGLFDDIKVKFGK